MLPGGADVGEALVTDPLVKVISFTGSTGAGRRVGELAGRHLKRVHLELGGNSALIVLDDVDLDRAVSAGAWGSFLHQGQICMTTGRHLVHEAIYDEYVERLAATASHLPVGNPATDQVALGPIIDAAQRDKVHALVTVERRGRRPAHRRRHLRGAVLPADRAGRASTRHAGLRQRGVRPGRAGGAVRLASTRSRSSPPTATTVCRSASSPPT